jgi:hypothetical protein
MIIVIPLKVGIGAAWQVLLLLLMVLEISSTAILFSSVIGSLSALLCRSASFVR